MKKEIKEQFPSWCNDKNEDLELMISDDLDSLMCYVFQNRFFKRECKYFIEISKKAYQSYDKTINRTGKQVLYNTKDATNKCKNTIALDFSIDKDIMSWDNHVVKISKNDKVNNLSANINIALDISSNNYTNKAIVSSFITMLSYYDIDIEKWDKEMLAVLCAIDGLYTPFLNTKFIATGTKNLKLLDYGFLAKFIKENMKYIQKIEKDLNLKNGKIWVNVDTGLLETNINLKKLEEIFLIDIELPSSKFLKKRELESKIFNTNNFTDKKSIEKFYNKKIFNIALTYGRSGVVSFIE